MNYKHYSLDKYLKALSEKNPVPGGGSAAALTAALGTALILMVTQYSIGKGSSKPVEKEFKRILKEAQKLRQRLLELVTLDAKAYLKVVAAKKKSPAAKKAAEAQARLVPQQVCQLSFRAVQLTPFIVKHGNRYLISDIEVADELLFAAFNSALALTRV